MRAVVEGGKVIWLDTFSLIRGQSEKVQDDPSREGVCTWHSHVRDVVCPYARHMNGTMLSTLATPRTGLSGSVVRNSSPEIGKEQTSGSMINMVNQVRDIGYNDTRWDLRDNVSALTDMYPSTTKRAARNLLIDGKNSLTDTAEILAGRGSR